MSLKSEKIYSFILYMNLEIQKYYTFTFLHLLMEEVGQSLHLKYTPEEQSLRLKCTPEAGMEIVADPRNPTPSKILAWK